MAGIHLRTALVMGLAVLIVTASPTAARELVTIWPAGEADVPGGSLGVTNRSPVIEVEGIARGRYGHIRNEKLTAWIVYFGKRPDWARRFKRTDVFVDNVKAQELPGPDHPKGPYPQTNGYAYPITFAYRTPGISGDPKHLKSVQTRCNEALANAKGSTRKHYIQNGVILKMPAAYLVKVVVIWDSRGRFERTPAIDTTWIGATIKCLPTGQFAATSKDTSTSSASQADIARELNKKKHNKLNKKKHNSGNNNLSDQSDPHDSRTNPKPTVRKLSLTAAPANVRSMGNWICPATIRLRGRVNVRREFKGSAIFLGDEWLSGLTQLDFDGAGGRYIVANYPIAWPIGGLSAASGSAPRQQLFFTFNVSDKNGLLKRSVRKDLTVTCRAS